MTRALPPLCLFITALTAACSTTAGSAFDSLSDAALDGKASVDTGALEQRDASTCSNGVTTSLRGTVYDPVGKNPLYDVVVYVPAGPVLPLETGATCGTCDSLYSGGVVTSTTTAADGTFTLANVPSGRDIPLVVQIGKWRRQFRVNVEPCVVTDVPDRTLTLPNNRTVGDIPAIAISIGGADTLECIFRRIGIDASEYGPGGASDGRIQIFNGAGAQAGTTPPAPFSYTSLWDSTADLEKYDLVLLSCEGDPAGTANVTPANIQSLADFTASGGRVLASHYHYPWIFDGPFASDNLTNWDFGLIDLQPPFIAGEVITTFPKGLAFQTWLTTVGALSNGALVIEQPRFNQFVTASNTASQAWVAAGPGAGVGAGATEYFSFNAPVGAPVASQCGRFVYSDLHVAGAVRPPDYSLSTAPLVPDDCTLADLTPQEKALEFMIFDISSCVSPDSEPPPPPPVPK